MRLKNISFSALYKQRYDIFYMPLYKPNYLAEMEKKTAPRVS